MSTEEVAAAPVSIVEKQPASDPALVPAAKEAPPAKKASTKTKKANAARKPRSPLAHPPYADMISEAISTLKERTGSSQHAITKFIEDKHNSKLSSNFKKIILFQLKKLTVDGKLVKVKASYKLSSSKPKPKKPAAKPKVKKATAPAKKTADPAKKAGAVKSKVAKTKKVAPKPKTKAPAAKVAKKSVKDTPAKKKVVAPAKKVAAPAKKAAPVKKPAAVKMTSVKKGSKGKVSKK